MNRNILYIIIVVALLFGSYLYLQNQNQTVSQAPGEQTAVTEQSNQEAEDDGTKTFVINGSNFKFEPNQIKVKQGDKVKITLINIQGFHDFIIEGYDVSTPSINQGEQTTVEFTADKTGTFVFYCSVGSHRMQGMVGDLIVE